MGCDPYVAQHRSVGAVVTMVVDAFHLLPGFLHQRVIDGQKDGYGLAFTPGGLQRAPRATIEHLPAYSFHLLHVPIHPSNEPKHTAGVFAARYRPAQPCQVSAAQVDQQTDHIGLKVPDLRRVAECTLKLAQEIAQIFVDLYNRVQHGFLGLGLLFGNINPNQPTMLSSIQL